MRFAPHIMGSKSILGASDGNRTHATSLEGWDSTIELHSLIQFLENCYNIIPQRLFFVKGFFKLFLFIFLPIAYFSFLW